MSFEPAEVLGRLQAIDTDLAHRQNSYEQSARQFFTAKRDWEYELAKARIEAQGTVQERADRALLGLAKSDCYKALIVAEADYEGAKAAIRTLETRASIGQSILRSQVRV